MDYPSIEFYLTYSSGLTSFAVTMTCLNSKAVVYFKFNWLAVDDQRITVIDKEVNVTSLSTQTFQFSHDNTYAKVGFVTYTGFGQSNVNDFLLEVVNILSNQVSVKFTKNSNNMLSIGFQVVIGTEDAFTATEIKNISYLKAYQDQGGILEKQAYKTLFLSKAGFAQTSITDNIRLQSLLTNNTGDSTITYMFDLCIKFQYNRGKFKLFQIQLLGNMDELQKLQSDDSSALFQIEDSKKEISCYLKINSFLYYQWYTQNAQIVTAPYSGTISKDPGSMNTLDLTVSIKCSSYQIFGYVLKCIDCKTQSYDLSTNCYGGIDFVAYHVTLTQTDQYVYQQVNVTVTTNEVTVTQLVVGPYGTLLSIQLK